MQASLYPVPADLFGGRDGGRRASASPDQPFRYAYLQRQQLHVHLTLDQFHDSSVDTSRAVKQVMSGYMRTQSPGSGRSGRCSW